MASTSATCVWHIKELLGDANPSDPLLSDFRYEAVVLSNVGLISARCQMPNASVVSVTLVAGTYEYAVSATATVQTIGQVLLNSNGEEMVFVPWEQFNAYYRQDTALPLANGVPVEYSLFENTSNLTRIRFGPTPSAAGTAKIHLSAIPAIDSGTIPFSDELLRGLEVMSAADIVLMLSSEKLAAAGLSKDAAQKWAADAERAIHDYNVRQARLGSRQNRILRGGGRRAMRTGAWA